MGAFLSGFSQPNMTPQGIAKHGNVLGCLKSMPNCSLKRRPTTAGHLAGTSGAGIILSCRPSALPQRSA